MFGNFGVNLGSVGNLFGASGPRLNYDLGEAYPRAAGGWTHYRATSKEDGAPASVFKFVCNDVHKERVRVEVARNGAKRLKTTSCLLYTSPSPRDQRGARMPSSA